MDKFELTPEEQAKLDLELADHQRIVTLAEFCNRIRRTREKAARLPTHLRTDSVRNALWVIPSHTVHPVTEENKPRIIEAMDYLDKVFQKHDEQKAIDKEMAKLDGSNYILPEDITKERNSIAKPWIVIASIIIAWLAIAYCAT